MTTLSLGFEIRSQIIRDSISDDSRFDLGRLLTDEPHERDEDHDGKADVRTPHSSGDSAGNIDEDGDEH